MMPPVIAGTFQTAPWEACNTLSISGCTDDIGRLVDLLERRSCPRDGDLGMLFLAFGSLLPEDRRREVDESASIDAQEEFDNRMQFNEVPYFITSWEEFVALRSATRWYGTDVTCRALPESEGIEYQFRTSWSPPLDAIIAASARFPALQFSLYYTISDSWELAMGMDATFDCQGGTVTDWTLKCYYFPEVLQPSSRKASQGRHMDHRMGDELA